MMDGDSRNENEVAVFALIERGFRELGLVADTDKIGRLTRLVSLLSQWAQRINLTGHRDPLEMASRLVLDAVALCTALPELEDLSSLADLGSGAGFPGSADPRFCTPIWKFVWSDSRLKRNHFQREACRRVGLPRVHPILADPMNSNPPTVTWSWPRRWPNRRRRSD